MVVRKPLPADSPAAQPPPRTSTAPYPTSPTSVYSTDQSPAMSSNPFAPPPTRAPPQIPPTAAEEDHGESDDEWDKSDPDWDADDDVEEEPEQPKPEDLPAPLKISRPGSAQSQKEEDLPAALRAGPSHEMLRKSHENLLPTESKSSLVSTTSSQQSNNPFLRPQTTGEKLFRQNRNNSASSSSVWPPIPVAAPSRQAPEPPAPVELPTVNSPVDRMSKMSLWDEQPPLIPVELEDEQPWKQQSEISGVSALSQPWKQESELSAVSALDNTAMHPAPEAAAWQQLRPAEEPAPQLQPRRSMEEQPPATPPRPQIDTSVGTTSTPQVVPESPDTRAKNQRKEHYQIKQIRWHDAYSKKLRTSPILIQNANGPCPLLALVNTLVLSTPMDVGTALIETLRTREQVSLGLLLDAVFDELMSGRRGTAAQELPDVSELYKFLLSLHTGMNVNPRFVFAPTRSSRDFHPALREYTQPGGFEDTREMKLYSTFNIPLMHGWLPSRNSPAYSSFDRSAKTYEDAQNIQFHEEELEDKLNSIGLTPEEQNLFEDLHTIKDFLSTWPTQLTDYGLNVLSEHLSAGQFAILFRNDHFSTMYKEPLSQQILTLVTDSGYSSHDEIVWESLVDINGQGSEHFSGDFRPVSHNAPVANSGPAPGPRNSSLGQQPVQSMLDVDQGWTTVQNNRKKQRRVPEALSALSTQENDIVSGTSGAAIPETPLSPAEKQRAEQEDHDLALALQLQEEEEDRARRSEAQRRREDELSQQFLERDQHRGNPVAMNNSIPVGSANSSAPNRPLIPPRRGAGNAGEEPPPPSYDQAAKSRPFHPPRDHPASEHAPTPPSGHRRGQSAYMQTFGSFGAGGPSSSPVESTRVRRNSSRPGTLIDQIPAGSGMGRARRTGSFPNSPTVVGPAGRGQNGLEDKCVVM